jgi:glyoxylase-like metal-dependent hydrolase (beta-lactamase superfamily II)
MPSRAFAVALASFCIVLPLTAAQADTDRSIDAILEPIQLTDRVYYFYGSIEGRSPHNLGMNNNVGFVVTDDGVVMIDSGPSHQVAARIADAVAGVTGQPITHVINLGSQDHRWLGNGWFVDHGAEIVALGRTTETQQRYAASHMSRSTRNLGADVMADTVPTVASEPIDADRHEMEVGGVRMTMIYTADAHFPGDIMLHLPEESVVFTGDVVYTERLLGIQPESDPEGKLANFQTLEALSPDIVVPGHGAATDLATARRDTGDYLEMLVHEVRAGLEDWETLDETVERLADLPQFQHLLHYDAWHRANVNQSYLIMEAK